jgi:hypothetical protein
MNRIGLINYEGDVVSLYKDDTVVGFAYLLVDQWGKTMIGIDLAGVYAYLSGSITVYDSRGKSWHFPSQDSEAKTELSKIINFLDK